MSRSLVAGRVQRPPRRPTTAEREALLDDLAGAGYTVDGVEALLGPLASAALHREQTLPALRVARASTGPTATLVTALLLGAPVARAELDLALARLGVDRAADLGLVEPAGAGRDDLVRPLVDLRPYAAVDAAGESAWWLASDQGEAATGRALDPEHVLGVGGASLTLAGATVRDHRARTLDLGTGCGVQALHASRHSDAVVATDVSARALAFAGFNAALAGVDLDLRAGSMLEPVAGERFDLVVSNPPFVITPRGARQGARFTYRDGGLAGDDLVRDLLRGVGDVLAPGGVAQLLGNWEHHGGEPWQDRLTGWLDGTGLDAWVVQREVLDPAQYAETWLRDGGTTPERDRAAWARAYAGWLDDFDVRGVEAVGLGLVVLRRPVAGEPTMRRIEERTGPVRQPLGGHLASCLAAHDWLAARDDAVLAAARLVVAPDVTEERHLHPGAEHPAVVLLRQGEGFGRAVQVGTAVAGLVGACDGDLAVGQVVGALAGLLDVEVAAMAAQVLPVVRDLVRDGFLRPA